MHFQMAKKSTSREFPKEVKGRYPSGFAGLQFHGAGASEASVNAFLLLDPKPVFLLLIVERSQSQLTYGQTDLLRSNLSFLGKLHSVLAVDLLIADLVISSRVSSAYGIPLDICSYLYYYHSQENKKHFLTGSIHKPPIVKKEGKTYNEGEFIVNLNKINYMIAQEKQPNAQEEDYRLSYKAFNSVNINKVFSARSCFQKQGTKEVTYENKIFNIRKKFTVPDYQHQQLQRQPQKKLSIVNEQKIRAKPSEVFSRHIDTIIKNRRLLRRGVWEMPFEPDTLIESKGKNRYKTEVSEGAKEKGISCGADHKKKISGSVRYLDYEKSNQFPQINSGGSTEYDVPVKLLQRKRSKPISCQTADTNQTILIRNAMSRKLAVELINYNLLGKWASSSFKT